MQSVQTAALNRKNAVTAKNKSPVAPMRKTNGISWKRALQYARSVFNIPKRNAVTANAKRVGGNIPAANTSCKKTLSARNVTMPP
jgi:hypothetical protein